MALDLASVRGEHALAIGDRVLDLRLGPKIGASMDGLEVEHYWELASDALKGQCPDSSSELRQATILYSVSTQTFTKVATVRSDRPSPIGGLLGYSPDPCFPPYLPTRHIWEDAILVSQVSPDLLDNLSQDLDAGSTKFLATLYQHVIAPVAHDLYEKLDATMAVLPESGIWEGDQVALAAGLEWWHQVCPGEGVPRGLLSAFVLNVNTNAVMEGGSKTDQLSDLAAMWHAMVNLSISQGGGGVTGVYLTSHTNAVLIHQTQDGMRLVVTVWHRDLPFEAMVARQEALVLVADAQPVGFAWN